LDKAWDSGLKETRRCGFKQQARPTIYLSTKVRQKIERLLEEVETEWLAYLEGRQEGDNFFVTDLYLPEQRVSEVSVEVVERSSEKAFLGVVHSHGELCAEWSNVDDDFINANNTLSILVGANGAEIRAQARYALPCGYFYRKEAVVRTEQRLDDEKFVEEIERKIKPIRSFYFERHRETSSAYTFSEHHGKSTAPKVMSRLPARTSLQSVPEKPRAGSFMAKMASKEQKMAIVAGSSNPDLAKEIAKQLDVPLCGAEIGRFPDGEIKVQIKDAVRGADVFIIQSTSPPVNENLMELLLMIDAVKRASAERVTVVMPYYGYARQDRYQAGQPLSAKLVARLLEERGVNRVVVLDLHSPQLEAIFEVPIMHLSTEDLWVEHFAKIRGARDWVVASPDLGAIKRVHALADRLNLPLVVCEKEREPGGSIRRLRIYGEVSDKKILILDDLIATGGTLIEAGKALMKAGAREIRAAATHGVFAKDALQQLESSPLQEIVVTDSIALPKRSNKIKVLSIANMLAEAIEWLYDSYRH